MARKVKIALDRTSDKIAKNGDRTRDYHVIDADSGNVVGTVTEHWHASAFADGKVDMSLYKNSVAESRRTFSAKTANGKRVDSGTTRANTVKNVRIAAFGK